MAATTPRLRRQRTAAMGGFSLIRDLLSTTIPEAWRAVAPGVLCPARGFVGVCDVGSVGRRE